MPTLTPQAFVAKWKNVTLKERSAAQEHFIDVCGLAGHPTPAEADPAGQSFTFEAGAEKQRGGHGFADVWKRGHFAWEMRLVLVHQKLDNAVLDAYGWPPDLSDEAILERLLALNLARAGD